MKFTDERKEIYDALVKANISTIRYNKDDVPKDLPAAIVTIDSERGVKPTSRGFTDTELTWTVYIIINSHDVQDPDTVLYNLKEAFRTAYRDNNRDLPKVEYYSSRIDGARPVRIAKIDIFKSGASQ